MSTCSLNHYLIDPIVGISMEHLLFLKIYVFSQKNIDIFQALETDLRMSIYFIFSLSEEPYNKNFCEKPSQPIEVIILITD